MASRLTTEQKSISFIPSDREYNAELLKKRISYHDVKTFNIPMLIPFTYEAKYQKIKIARSDNQPLGFLTDLLTKEEVSTEEAARIIKEGKSLFFREQNSMRLSMNEIEGMYQKFDINLYEVIQQAQNATIGVVEDLHLPSKLEQKIIGKLKEIDVKLRIGQQSKAKSQGKGLSSSIDPQVPLLTAHLLASFTGQEVTGSLVRSLLAALTAHELGHIVDFSAYYHPNQVIQHIASNTVASEQSTYPIQFLNTSGRDREINWMERFAGYFEQAAVAKLNLSVEAIEDLRRMNLSQVVSLLSKITPERLSQFLTAIRNTFSPDDPAGKQLGKSIQNILTGESIAQSFPFTKEQVYGALITSLSEIEQSNKWREEQLMKPFIIEEPPNKLIVVRR